MIRGSDDFYPRDRGSHSPHIYANAFNGLMISNCGLQVTARGVAIKVEVLLLLVVLVFVLFCGGGVRGGVRGYLSDGLWRRDRSRGETRARSAVCTVGK